MKQRKRPTRIEKKQEYRTIENWLKAREEKKRKAKSEKLNEELNYNKGLILEEEK